MEHEAGPVLDNFVATRVMGLTPVIGRAGYAIGMAFPDGQGYTPAYSTTGDGMLLVIERMRALGWMVEMTMWCATEPVPYPAWARFKPVTIAIRQERRAASATTLPHAVALAALAALEAEHD
jgi:hypothetical protein